MRTSNSAKAIRFTAAIAAVVAVAGVFAVNLDKDYKFNCYNESHIQGNQAKCCDIGCKVANPNDPSGQQSCYADCMAYDPGA